MSMTREEAIELVCYGDWLNILMPHLGDDDINRLAEAMCIIGNALRPVSREQIEKVWSGCQMCEGWNTIELKPCANGDLGVRADIGSAGQADPFGLVVYNNLLASGYVDFQFCPFCGSPKTDEAVQMMVERLEAMKDGDTTD